MGAQYKTGWLKASDQREAYREFQEMQIALAHKHGDDPYNGTFSTNSGVQFTDRMFSSVEAADEWLQAHTEKWEAVKAVRVRDRSGWYLGAWVST